MIEGKDLGGTFDSYLDSGCSASAHGIYDNGGINFMYSSGNVL